MKKYEFKLIKNYYDSYELFKNEVIQLQSALTILVGCNGYGKTTFIKQLEDNLIENNIPYRKYDNYREGSSNAIDKYLNFGNTTLGMTNLVSSEGEQIYNNFGEFISGIRRFTL